MGFLSHGFPPALLDLRSRIERAVSSSIEYLGPSRHERCPFTPVPAARLSEVHLSSEARHTIIDGMVEAF
jgi:hypothetical protein